MLHRGKRKRNAEREKVNENRLLFHKKVEDIAFDKMAKAICSYLKLKGWQIITLGDIKIQKPFGSLKYIYELVFRVTAKSLKEQ